jgi:phage shock protein PspC (stress-responsive transcriptional regulator)
MTAALITIAFAVAGFAVFFFVVKRLVRMAVRVALVGGLFFALLVAAVAWYFYAPSSDATRSGGSGRQSATPTRPARK